MKTCSKCGIPKELTEFYFKSNSKKVLRPECKKCSNKGTSTTKIKNKAAYRIVAKQYYEKNRETLLSNSRSYYAEHKTERKITRDAWKKNNKDRLRSYDAKRRAAEIQATPDWIDYANIDKFYSEAWELEKQTGNKYHVDHIDPLIHPNVCGLNVPWNLQILTASDNLSKGNKFTPWILSEL